MMQTRDGREYSRAFRESAPASSMSAPRKILVTSALPNANGSIHLGHLLEHIQTDIWVRFQRLRGNQCTYVCADDTHGTATMLKAEQLGVPAEELIEQIRVEHENDFKRFLVAHDNFYSTHSEENRRLCEGIYTRLFEGGYIFTRDVEQRFDPERKLFLADRFVKGECPRCGSDDQYGNQSRQDAYCVTRHQMPTYPERLKLPLEPYTANETSSVIDTTTIKEVRTALPTATPTPAGPPLAKKP